MPGPRTAAASNRMPASGERPRKLGARPSRMTPSGPGDDAPGLVELSHATAGGAAGATGAGAEQTATAPARDGPASFCSTSATATSKPPGMASACSETRTAPSGSARSRGVSMLPPGSSSWKPTARPKPPAPSRLATGAVPLPATWMPRRPREALSCARSDVGLGCKPEVARSKSPRVARTGGASAGGDGGAVQHCRLVAFVSQRRRGRSSQRSVGRAPAKAPGGRTNSR
mmetsp:Transcript_2986/g.12212  ORF Transcript_2986/g.12212 Transcript_2986/m.12212 type:complete len:230 (-) Transcript_2986:3732-4421(-)